MKGILLSPEMARAVCDGRKTQTRRVVSPPSWMKTQPITGPIPPYSTWRGWWFASTWRGVRCDYQPGERRCLLTTWAVGSWLDHLKPTELMKENFARELDLWHAGMGVPKYKESGKLRPGRFLPNHIRPLMPQLEILSVRAERVQDITDNDAIAEGVDVFEDGAGFTVPGHGWTRNEADAFRFLWDNINAKRGFGWAANPWVWVVTFRKANP